MSGARQDSWSLGTWGRVPVSLHWTALLSFAWLYIIFWDVLATLFGGVALLALFAAHEFGHVFMLRRRKIAVTEVMFFGVHGQTLYNEYAAKPADAVAVAWAGVLAQLLVLALAVLANAFVPFAAVPYALVVWAPMYLVFTKFNIFLMIVALLPIGPFDGHDAWRVIPRMRQKWKRPKARTVRAAPPPPEPEPVLPPEQQRELDAASQKATAELLARLAKKGDMPARDD